MKSFTDRIGWLVATGGNPCGFFDTLFSDFLGPVAAFAGAALFPEFAIPAEIAGGFLGGTAGGLIGGKSAGQSLLQGAETGAISGATGFIGQELGGVSPSSVVGDLFGGGAAPNATPGISPGGVAAPTPAATPAAAPTESLTAPPGGGAAGIVGGLTGDPGALLGQTGGQSFLGTGAGGPTNLSGAPADASGGGGDSFNPASTFYAPGTDTAVPYGNQATAGAFDATGGGGGVSNFVSQHWPLLAGAGILGFEALTSNKPLPQEQALQANATQAAGQAAALEAPLQTGQLPPGAQQAVNSATAASKAAAKSNFASLGLSGSTMEAQQLQAIDRNAASQTFQIADSLLAKGIDLSRLSAQDLEVLLNEQLRQDAQFTGALGQFAGGLAGGRLGGNA